MCLEELRSLHWDHSGTIGFRGILSEIGAIGMPLWHDAMYLHDIMMCMCCGGCMCTAATPAQWQSASGVTEPLLAPERYGGLSSFPNKEGRDPPLGSERIMGYVLCLLGEPVGKVEIHPSAFQLQEMWRVSAFPTGRASGEAETSAPLRATFAQLALEYFSCRGKYALPTIGWGKLPTSCRQRMHPPQSARQESLTGY